MTPRDRQRAAGSGGARQYHATTLDVARLRRYAKRVATETQVSPQPKLVRQVTKSVPATETRRAGFLGFRTEVVKVTKSIQATELVVGPHWILHHTDHHIESHDRGKFIEYGEQNYWALQNDGSLVKIWDWEEFTRWDNGTTRFEKECTATPMTEEDILRLDFADRRYDLGSHGHGAKYWGNRDAGQLVRHAKGVGLSVALKALLPN